MSSPRGTAMSIFKSLAAGARAAHGHYFGTSTGVTIQDPGGAVKTVQVVLGEEMVETRREGSSDVRYYIRECRFVTLTSVRHDAVITVGTNRYSIDQFLDRQASGLTVKIKRQAVIDTNRDRYRM